MTGAPAKAIFTGASGNRLAADVFGESGPSVLLLHGGGQTRHAWRKTAERLAQAGWTAYALDQRGHGDSEWVADAAYAFADFAADAVAVADALAGRSGRSRRSVRARPGGACARIPRARAACRLCRRRRGPPHVAGDSNENFSAAILEFLGRNAGEAPGGTIRK